MASQWAGHYIECFHASGTPPLPQPLVRAAQGAARRGLEFKGGANGVHDPSTNGSGQANASAGATRGGLTRQSLRGGPSATHRRGTAGQFADRADTSFSRFMEVAAMSTWMRTISWFR